MTSTKDCGHVPTIDLVVLFNAFFAMTERSEKEEEAVPDFAKASPRQARQACARLS